jgi:hypothetical protein
MDNQVVNPIVVNDYVLLHHATQTERFKRLKRKLKNKSVWQTFTNKTYKDFQKDAVGTLVEFLKMQKTSQKTNIGVLVDHNVLLHDINVLPPPPLEWDVLCLEADIAKYDFEDQNNNVYWCSSVVNDSGNFVVNPNSLKKVLDLASGSATWQELILKLNTLKLFTITQYMLSTNIKRHIADATTDTLQSQQVYQHLSTESQPTIMQVDSLVASFDKLCTNDEMMPNVSLICVLSNTKIFFQALYSFLLLNYPRDRLELIIVDDIDAEKRLKSILPNDARIKIVNVTKKQSDGSATRFPLGYKLNIGIKYASHNLIAHWFDTNMYFMDNFKSLVKAYIMSQTECVMSVDQGFSQKESVKRCTVPCISNMLYSKNFWKVNSFHERCSDSNVLVNEFTKNRRGCIQYVPFLYFSVGLSEPEHYAAQEASPTALSISGLFDKRQRECFQVTSN